MIRAVPAEESLQRICAAFRACSRAFKDMVPAWFYNKVEPEIMQTCLRLCHQKHTKHISP